MSCFSCNSSMSVKAHICIGFKSLNILLMYMMNKAAAWILNLKLAYVRIMFTMFLVYEHLFNIPFKLEKKSVYIIVNLK